MGVRKPRYGISTAYTSRFAEAHLFRRGVPDSGLDDIERDTQVVVIYKPVWPSQLTQKSAQAGLQPRERSR